MVAVEGSLRLLVEKWLGPTLGMPARVTWFGRMSSNQRRYVCIKTLWPAGALAIYFFLHDDGTWCVFPSEAKRPAMSVSLCTA
ncbi:hypothetical protein KNO81_40035 [Paraburkholderia sediminicola]|jgi:hypothetical protein|nr:hypothetical protein [Paraburkholderia sediminicola]